MRAGTGTADVVQHFRSCWIAGSLMRDASGWACRRSGLGRRMLLVRKRQPARCGPHNAMARSRFSDDARLTVTSSLAIRMLKP